MQKSTWRALANRCVIALSMAVSFVLSAVVGGRLQEKRALVFDTGIHVADQYQHSMDSLKQLGWSVTYLSLEESLRIGLDGVFAPEPRLCIFIINDEFLRSEPASVVGQFVRDALARSAARRGALTAVMLPSTSRSLGKTASKLLPVFKALGLQVFLKDLDGGVPFGKFKKAMLRFLVHPLMSRSIEYHTSLRLPETSFTSISKHAHAYLENQEGDVLWTLPRPIPGRFKEKHRMGALLPLGTCFFSAERDHTFLISYSSLMETLNVAEDIHVLPFDVGMQAGVEHLLTYFWSDVDTRLQNPQARSRESFESVIKKRGDSVGVSFKHAIQPKKETKKPTKTSWMELVAFDETGSESRAELAHKRRQQKSLVMSLLEAGIGVVWLSLSPQMYYGVHAKYPEKREVFEAGFLRFAKMLKTEGARLNRLLPKIFVGFEIANNLYNKHLPKEFAVDLYGTAYPDVPSPCSMLFWEEEVIRPLEAFMTFFNENKVQNHVALGGIVLDCELYGRLNTSSFSSLMLGDQHLVRDFCKHVGMQCEPKNFIDWVVRQRKLHALIEFAGQRVRECGQSIKNTVAACIPKGSIACYAPIVSIDWFLSNFCNGLGSPEKPFQLFTFNTSFERIKSVVERKFGLSIKHSTVLMLSKFCGPSDYALLDRAMDCNDGYWFNRWSRFVEPRDAKAWHVIEQPGLESQSDCSAFYSRVAAL